MLFVFYLYLVPFQYHVFEMIERRQTLMFGILEQKVLRPLKNIYRDAQTITLVEGCKYAF